MIAKGIDNFEVKDDKESGEEIVDINDFAGKGNQHYVYSLCKNGRELVLKVLGLLGRVWDHDKADLMEKDQQILEEKISPHLDIMETQILRDVTLRFEDREWTDEIQSELYEDLKIAYGPIRGRVEFERQRVAHFVKGILNGKEKPGYVMLQPREENIQPVTRTDLLENNELRDKVGDALKEAIKLWKEEGIGIDLAGGELVKAYVRGLFNKDEDLAIFNVWMTGEEGAKVPTLVDTKLIRYDETRIWGKPFVSLLMPLQYVALAAVLEDAGYEGIESNVVGRSFYKFFKAWRGEKDGRFKAA